MFLSVYQIHFERWFFRCFKVFFGVVSMFVFIKCRSFIFGVFLWLFWVFDTSSFSLQNPSPFCLIVSITLKSGDFPCFLFDVVFCIVFFFMCGFSLLFCLVIYYCVLVLLLVCGLSCDVSICWSRCVSFVPLCSVVFRWSVKVMEHFKHRWRGGLRGVVPFVPFVPLVLWCVAHIFLFLFFVLFLLLF